MVFGLIASDGQAMKPHFVKQGVKLNTEEYIAILRDKVKPWVTKTYGRDVKVVLQQDEAPCHTSKLTQAWLDEHFSARSGNLDFWAKDFQPPSSPDLNPLDYSIWAEVEKDACKKPHGSIKALKTSITNAWKNMSKEYIKNVCDSFRGRVTKVIENNGGIFE